MSNELSDDAIAMLKAQAEYVEQQRRLAASLTPSERAIRERFERALFGPEPPPEPTELIVHRPEALLAIAQAYMDEARNAGVDRVTGWLPAKGCASSWPATKPNPVQKEHVNQYLTAAILMVGLWMAVQGHEEFIEHFVGPVSLPPIPPLPRSWSSNMERVCDALGAAWAEPEKVTPLFA